LRNASIKLGPIQWPTLAMLFFCYAGIAVVTWLGNGAWLIASIPALSLLLALHSSLQHELLHGNPFKKAWLNDLMGFPALGLFVPYQRFKTTHLAHHHDERLTDPHDDPESNYLDPAQWSRLPNWVKMMYRCNNTLAGRMLIGPIVGMGAFYKSDVIAILKGNTSILAAYIFHIIGIALASAWMIGVADWSIVSWIIASYGALSILRIRTFLEHTANALVPHRTAIVNDRGLLAYVFLNNNLHAVHHTHPRMPWYELPKCYRRHKDHYDQLNNHYHFANYTQVFKHYFASPKDPVPHPLIHSTHIDGPPST